jgi:bifunctional non-homologous end joining protein LigD
LLGHNSVVAIPDWLEPMAATLTQERFEGPEWVFEQKFDGIRLIAFRHEQQIHLFSRNRKPQNCPAVAAAIARLDVDNAILDGELTWGHGGVVYHVFDVLWLDGRDLTGLTLDERTTALDSLAFSLPLQRVPRLTDPRPWERACQEGWEGVIAKRRDSRYEQRRSSVWLKMKCEASQELVVGGFTDPQGGRVGLGALLVGYFENEEFVFAGKVGTGFDTKLLLGLRAQLEAAEIPKSPFTKATGLPRLRVHWVRPEVVVEVSFIEWTAHGKLRHSRFLRVRTDKPARDVVREAP